MAKRAMTDEAKATKAQAILDTAAKMFAETEYEKLKMSNIAKEMGISNGILFVYFKTKEMLFFKLLMREYANRLDRLEKIVTARPIDTYQDFKKLVLDEMSDVIDSAPMYIRLCSIRTVIIERNSDMEQMILLKQSLYQRIQEVSSLICEKCNVFTQEEVMGIFMTQESILVGCKLSADLPKDVIKMMNDYSLDGFAYDFKSSAMKTMDCYLDGFHSHGI